jgi:flagellar biosynthesis chaperone FliJ
LRQLEEEQSRLELDAAVGLRNQAKDRVSDALRLQSQSRNAFATAVRDEDPAGRARATLELGETLDLRLRAEERAVHADAEVEKRRDEFLLKRMGRQQVESLVEKQAAQAREEYSRRAQQMLDDWYGRKPRRGEPLL